MQYNSIVDQIIREDFKLIESYHHDPRFKAAIDQCRNMVELPKIIELLIQALSESGNELHHAHRDLVARRSITTEPIFFNNAAPTEH